MFYAKVSPLVVPCSTGEAEFRYQFYHTRAVRLVCQEEADTLQQLNYCGGEETGGERKPLHCWASGEKMSSFTLSSHKK